MLNVVVGTINLTVRVTWKTVNGGGEVDTIPCGGWHGAGVTKAREYCL